MLRESENHCDNPLELVLMLPCAVQAWLDASDMGMRFCAAHITSHQQQGKYWQLRCFQAD